MAFEISPVLLLGFTAGAIVDRLPRRTVKITANLGRATVAIGLAAVPNQL